MTADRPPAPGGVTGLARRALLWTYAGSAGTLLLQLGYTAITARALPPAAFGPFASSQVLVTMLGYLSLNSVGAAVARSPGAPRSLVGSAWTLALLGGLTAAVLAVLAAPLWAAAWNSPDADVLVLASVPAVLLVPLSTLALALLRQRLRFRAAVVAEVTGALAGFGVGGALIVGTRQPWALPVAVDTACAVTLVVASVLRRERPHLGWNRPDVRVLVGFVAPVSALNAGYAALNALPQLIVSRLFGGAVLAQLNRAVMLVTLPQSQLSQGVMKVSYPLFARLRDQPDRRREATTATLVLASGAVAVVFGLLAGSARPLVRILLGDPWLPAAGLVPLVGAGAAGYVLMGLVSMMWESTGQLRRVLLTQAGLLVVMTAATAPLWATARVTVPAVLCAFALSQAAAHCLQLALLAREGLVDLGTVARAYAVHGTVAAAVVAGLHQLAGAVRDSPPLAAGVVQAVAVVAVVAGLALGRRTLPAWTTAVHLGLARPTRSGRHAAVGGRHSLTGAGARRSDRRPVSTR